MNASFTRNFVISWPLTNKTVYKISYYRSQLKCLYSYPFQFEHEAWKWSPISENLRKCTPISTFFSQHCSDPFFSSSNPVWLSESMRPNRSQCTQEAAREEWEPEKNAFKRHGSIDIWDAGTKSGTWEIDGVRWGIARWDSWDRTNGRKTANAIRTRERDDVVSFPLRKIEHHVSVPW